jgi:hypothetical protein
MSSENIYKEILDEITSICNQDYYGMFKETHKDRCNNVLNKFDFLLQEDKTIVLDLIKTGKYDKNLCENTILNNLPNYRNDWFLFMKGKNYIE